jgi:hypothetical protein
VPMKYFLMQGPHRSQAATRPVLLQ